MPDIEEIRAAEANVAQMQDALETVQAGLGEMEEVAETIEEAKADSEMLIKAAVAVLGVATVLFLISMLRRRR